MHTYIEYKKGIFRSHNLGRAIVRYFNGLFVPPLIPTFCPRHLIARPLQNEHMLDNGAFFECGIYDRLRSNGFTTSLALIGSNHNTLLAVHHAIAQ